MRIVCQQTILMKYHALLLFLKKAAQFGIVDLLQIIGGALGVKEILRFKFTTTFQIILFYWYKCHT